MKVALVCLMLCPFSLLFGQQILNLSLVPQQGLYQAVHTYSNESFALQYELKANVRDESIQDRLVSAMYGAFSYTDSLWLSDYAFLSKRSWKALRYQRPGFSLALLDDGNQQKSAMLRAGSFSAFYLFGPKNIQSDEIECIWDRYLFGQNCIVHYTYEGNRAFFVLEGLWGEYRRLDFSTTLGLNLGPWTLQSQFRGQGYLKMRTVSIQVQHKGLEVQHTWTTSLGLAPIYSGQYQTMNLTLETKATYKQIRLLYEQSFAFDAQGSRACDREMQLFYSTAFMQVGLRFTGEPGPIVSFTSGSSNVVLQACSLAATCIFQRSWGSVRLVFHPSNGLTISYAYVLTSGLHSESLPQA